MTNGQFVSRIINDLKALNRDEHISKRHILFIGRSKAKTYIAQKLGELSLFYEDKLYKYISCFPMQQIDTIDCCIAEFRVCRNIMRSVNKLPELLHSKHHNSIRSVTTIDNEYEFKPITPRNYRLEKDRLYGGFSNSNFFYVLDGYLWLPDSTIELVNIEVMTLEEEKVNELSSCSNKVKEDDCVSVWDMEFLAPDKLEELIVQETLKEVILTKQFPTDENPNMDSNIKTQTIK